MSYEKAKSLMRKSVSRPTLFTLDIPPLNSTTNDYLRLFCVNASVPEVSYETATVLGQSAMGVYRDQPSAVKFGRPLTIRVIENTDFLIYKSLRVLYDKIADGSNPSSFGTQNQRMKYYDTYTFDLTLTKLEYPDGKNSGFTGNLTDAPYRAVEKFVFRNAYLSRIQSIDLNTEAQNTYTSFSVDFNFETYSTSNSLGKLITNVGGGAGTGRGAGTSGFDIGGTINNLSAILKNFGIL